MSDATQQSLIQVGHESYAPNYNPRPVVFDHGQGSRIWDVEGREYLDLGTGIGVNCLGHRNPQLIEAINAQVNRLWHTSNIYFSEPPIRLAAEIIGNTFADKVYFCNSGAEANEAAIKTVRKYAADNFGASKHVICTFKGSFHGRTIGALTATAQPKYHQGFEPLPQGFRYCEFNDIDSLRKMMGTDVCAVILEPIQGEGGIRPFSVEFLQQARQLCNEYEALLAFDEVQCGMGRTGKIFAYQWADGVEPDLVTIAKALGGGLPIGALLLSGKVANTLGFGSHGSTFGGNPVCCEAARVVLKTVVDHSFLAEIAHKGELLQAQLSQMQRHHSMIEEIRGRGLMIGIKLYGASAGEVMQACLENGLLVLQSGADVIRLLPAFTISADEIACAMEILNNVLASID